MGTTLQHGIFLPAEGERNCYAGLASNWTIIDGVVGGYSSHAANLTIHVTAADKEAWNGKADSSALTAHTGDTTIHVTAADKEAWNGKADASALTAHTGNTTIHVTAEDKNKWDAVTGKADASALTAHTGNTTIHVTAEDKNKWDAVTGKADASALTAHTGNTTIHVTAADKEAWNGKADASALTAHTGDTTIHVTAEDKTKWDAVTGKADDADVLHKSGDETSTGIKNFVDNIVAKKIVSNVSQLQINAKTNADSVAIIAGPSATEGGGIWIYGKNSSNQSQVVMQVYDTNASAFHAARLNMDGSLTPTVANNGLGSSSFKWRGFNSINPGALSLPDFSAGVDISGYITAGNTHNEYTPTADGWITVALKSTSGACALWIYQNDICNGFYGNSARPGDTEPFAAASIPVKANTVVNIDTKGSNSYVYAAKFYPCRGNV